MAKWECSVCGYVHEDEKAPATCPICEAPEKMFHQVGGQDNVEPEVVVEQPVAPVAEVAAVGEPAVQAAKVEEAAGEQQGAITGYRCKVCGYIHQGTAPPEKCPVCDAPAVMFEPLRQANEGAQEKASERRWRCTVCGYVHTGPTPPEKCPVCAAPAQMFVEIDVAGKQIGELPEQEVVAASTGQLGKQDKRSLLDAVADLVLKHHLHPITVHFPNGILPMVVTFLALSVFVGKLTMLEPAAFYSLIFVLLMMPPVVLTGYFEWQKRYLGAKTAVFVIKIICAGIVLGAVNLLVFWRLLDPQVLAVESPYRMVYLGIAGGMLLAAGIAGHLGGKLVFASRG